MTNPTKACELSSTDFDLFWGWLTYTKCPKDVARTAEISKLVRIFSTLDMFKTNADMNSYIKSWDAEKEFTVYAYELKTGLMMMTDAQFLRFYRFIVALQVKAREGAAKLEKKKAKEAAKQRQEEEERVSAKKRGKGNHKFNKSAAIHPCEGDGWDEGKSSDGIGDQDSSIPEESNYDGNSEERSQTDTTLDPNVIKTFKSKYKIEKNSSSTSDSGLFGTFVSFLKRSFSSRSSAYKSTSSLFSSRSTSAMSSSVFSSGVNKTNSNSFRQGYSADESDAGSEDGFSQRLTRANLSILREEICGDDAISNYRRLGEHSEIEESLRSFGVSSSQDQCSSFEQISSHDYHSTFERVSSHEHHSTLEHICSIDKEE